MWILLAFGSAVFAGLTAILAKIGIENTDSNVATAVRTAFVLLFSWMMVFVTGVQGQLGAVDGNTLLFLCLSGVATGGSWLCYFKALQCGDVNKVAPVDKSSTVLTMLLAFVLLGEPVTLLKVLAMGLIAAGTYLMIAKKQTDREGAPGKQWLLYALLSALFASLTAILGKIGIQGVDATLGTAIRTVVVLVMAWLMVFLQKKQGQVGHIGKKSWLFLALSAVATGGSWLCYYHALKLGPASVVVPIDKLSIVLTVAFSYFFLKEKLRSKALVGLLVLVSGTVLLLVKT